jgi:hypothetical protein
MADVDSYKINANSTSDFIIITSKDYYGALKDRLQKSDAVSTIFKSMKTISDKKNDGKDRNFMGLNITTRDDKKWYMPLPNNINEAFSQGWEDTNFNIAGGVVSKLVSGAGGGDSISRLAGSMSPMYFQTYQPNGARTFTFDFALLPNNTKEAEESIVGLIALKKYASGTKNGFVITPPSVFSIKFSNEKLDDLTRIGAFVIKDMSFTYGADGRMSTYRDGNIKSINVTMTVSEIQEKFFGDW